MPKSASAARIRGVLKVKKLNKCTLSILVLNLFFRQSRTQYNYKIKGKNHTYFMIFVVLCTQSYSVVVDMTTAGINVRLIAAIVVKKSLFRRFNSDIVHRCQRSQRQTIERQIWPDIVHRCQRSQRQTIERQIWLTSTSWPLTSTWWHRQKKSHVVIPTCNSHFSRIVSHVKYVLNPPNPTLHSESQIVNIA